MLEGWSGLVAQGSSAAIEADQDQIDASRPEPLRWLNNGRPLNFKRDGFEMLSPVQIGITQALLFAGVVTAATRPKDAPKQFVPLDAAHHLSEEPELERLHNAALTFWEQNGGDTVDKLSVETPPASPVRPDVNGAGASHAEWMSFLSSLQRPVCPLPGEAAFQPGLYFFQDDDGQVRCVDTSRPKALGAAFSAPAGLDVVPARAHPVTNREPEGWVLELRRGAARSVVGFDLENGKPALQPEQSIVGLRAISTARPTTVDYSGEKKLSTVYDAGDSYLFTFPRSTQLNSLKKKLHGEVLVSRPDQEVILEVSKTPPQVAFNEIFPNSTYARAYAGYRVPAAFTSIEAVATIDDTGMRVLVGRTADGRLALSALVPGPAGQNVQLLPDGAVFRGAHRGDPSRPWDVTVSYTLPTDAVELRPQLRSQTVSFG